MGRENLGCNFLCFLLYLLTAWSRVLLEKLTGFQIVEKFPAFYGTRRFITAFTSAPTCIYPERDRSHFLHYTLEYIMSIFNVQLNINISQFQLNINY